jgi:hypothetical protein
VLNQRLVNLKRGLFSNCQKSANTTMKWDSFEQGVKLSSQERGGGMNWHCLCMVDAEERARKRTDLHHAYFIGPKERLKGEVERMERWK